MQIMHLSRLSGWSRVNNLNSHFPYLQFLPTQQLPQLNAFPLLIWTYLFQATSTTTAFSFQSFNSIIQDLKLRGFVSSTPPTITNALSDVTIALHLHFDPTSVVENSLNALLKR